MLNGLGKTEVKGGNYNSRIAVLRKAINLLGGSDLHPVIIGIWSVVQNARLAGFSAEAGDIEVAEKFLRQAEDRLAEFLLMKLKFEYYRELLPAYVASARARVNDFRGKLRDAEMTCPPHIGPCRMR